MSITEKEIEELENDIRVYKPLVAQMETDITRVNTARDMKKKQLKELIDTVYKVYPDWSGKPEDLEAFIRKQKEVARIKMDNVKEEVRAGREILDPILKELE